MAEISLDFKFRSRREKVWEALTDPDILSEWVMPNDFKPIVGHQCQFRNEEINLVVDSVVLAVEAPVRLSYTWVGGPLDTVVTWTLTEDEEWTVLHLDHTGFREEDMAYNGARYGWSAKIETLARILDQE